MLDVTPVYAAEMRNLLKENAALRVALAEERLRVGFARREVCDLEARLALALPETAEDSL